MDPKMPCGISDGPQYDDRGMPGDEPEDDSDDWREDEAMERLRERWREDER